MKEQIELGFGPLPKANRTVVVTKRKGANWWFRRMRTVVDQAFDWPAADPSPTALRQPQLLLHVK